MVRPPAIDHVVASERVEQAIYRRTSIHAEAATKTPSTEKITPSTFGA